MSNDNGSQHKRVAILVENNFEDQEFNIPYTALQQANAEVILVGSRMNDEYQGKRGEVTVKPDATATEVRAEDFNAIVIPGGGAPDKIRTNDNVVRLVIDSMAQSKLIAAICHGPQVLIEADQLRGRHATGYRAIRKDMQNAGAHYVDEPVVVEDNLITSRRPGDLPIFTTWLLIRLGLTIEGLTFPDTTDPTSDDWWPLAEHWGGSSRQDILVALNTAIVGERYTMAAFQQYTERVSEMELQVVLQEAIAIKEQNQQILERRLHQFGEQVTWQVVGSEAYATLQGWLQSSDDVTILRRALGDVQTGVVDANHLSSRLTDPVTVGILEQVHIRLALLEQRLGDLYRARSGSGVKPPLPTTVAVS
jgi:protease I